MEDFATRFRRSVASKLSVAQEAERATRALNLQETRFREDEINTCPCCGGQSWWIGRTTAECNSCKMPVEILSSTVQSSAPVRLTVCSVQDAPRGRFVVNGRF